MNFNKKYKQKGKNKIRIQKVAGFESARTFS